MNEFASTLLIVEPDERLAEVLLVDFESCGFVVRSASAGERALEILSSEKVIALISNTKLEGTVGTALELIDKALAAHCCPPVVVLTTSETDFLIEKAFKKGVDAVFIKPFSRATLENLIKSAIIPFRNKLNSRKAVRVNVDLLVEVMVHEGEKKIKGHALNLSQGGLFIAVSDGMAPNIGDTIEFTLETSNGEKYRGKAEVSWLKILNPATKQFGFGIKFDEGVSKDKNFVAFVNTLKTTLHY